MSKCIAGIALLLNDEIEDNLLRLIFIACHPVLSRDARVALTLRLVGGLTTEEIARYVGNTSQDQEILPLLRQADLVKFADTIPTPDGKVRHVEAARTYIRQTGPMQTEALDARHHPEAGP